MGNAVVDPNVMVQRVGPEFVGEICTFERSSKRSSFFDFCTTKPKSIPIPCHGTVAFIVLVVIGYEIDDLL